MDEDHPFPDTSHTDHGPAHDKDGPVSATGVFATAGPVTPKEDDVLKPQPRREDTPNQPGSFTQMFEALSSKPDETQAPTAAQASPVPASAQPKQPADLTGVFTPVSIPKPAAPSTSSPTPEPKPGEFTQLLRTLDNPVVTANTSAAETGPSPSATGSFTQMFQTLSSSKPLEHTEERSAQQTPPPAPAAASGFTQMFQALSAKQEAAAPIATEAPQKPGSFTEMFSRLNAENAPAEDPLASLKTGPSATPFSTPAPLATPSAAPAIPAQGGFTQLFQALGKEGPPLTEPSMQTPAPSAAPPPVPPAAGGFTQLLRTLSAEPAPPAPPSAPPLAPAPMPPSPGQSTGQFTGPGEFTRVISGSMLREAQGQNPASGGPPVIPPASAAQPAFQPPSFAKMPAAPHMPQMPHVPQMHGGGAAGTPAQMPHFSPPAFPFPQPAPPVTPQPPAPGKLQQYLPLILVVNIFVLIVVVLIVIFMLRHH